MASLFNGVKISLLMQQSNQDYSYIAFPTFDTTVNNYEDDATEIKQCYISGSCPVSYGIDFNGETLLMVDDLSNSNCIINTSKENITKLKYGDFGINAYTENNGTFYDLRGNVGVKNKDVTYIGYIDNTKKELKLQNLNFWEVVPKNDSDFILTHVPLFKSEKGTFEIIKKHDFSGNPHNASNALVKFKLDDNEIEFIFLFKYELGLKIDADADNYDFNFARFLYTIKNVKFNNNDCDCELNTDDNGNKVTYTSGGNIILLYTVKHNLPNSDIERYTPKDGYSYCHKDHIFEFVLYNNNVNCCVDYCQMSFARTTNLILPKTISSNSTNDFVKSTKGVNDKLIVSLNDSNKTNYTFGEGETSLYNFYNFCNHWNNYYMYKPIDQLTFLKQGNYKFKCYNILDEEVPGNILLLPCNHNLCIYDRNKTITTGYTIKLESDIGNFDNWTSRETKISNLEKEIEKYYALYDYIKNNIGEESLHPDNLEERIKNIYNHITTDDVYLNGYRNYESDYNLIYNRPEVPLPANVKDLVKENIFKSCVLYNNNSGNSYYNTYPIKINDINYKLKIQYDGGSAIWIAIAKEGVILEKFVLIAHPYKNNINFINNSGLHSNIPSYFSSVNDSEPYLIDINSYYWNLNDTKCLQLTFSQFLVNVKVIEDFFKEAEEGEGSEGGSTTPEIVEIIRRDIDRLSYLINLDGGLYGGDPGLVLNDITTTNKRTIEIELLNNVGRKELDCTYTITKTGYRIFRCDISFSDYTNGGADGLGTRTVVSFILNSNGLTPNSQGWVQSDINVTTIDYKASSVYDPKDVSYTSERTIKWKYVDGGDYPDSLFLNMKVYINVGTKYTKEVEIPSNARSMSNMSRTALTATEDETYLIEYIPSVSNLELLLVEDGDYYSSEQQSYKSAGVTRNICVERDLTDFFITVANNSTIYSYDLFYHFGHDVTDFENKIFAAKVKYKINDNESYKLLGEKNITITKYDYDDNKLCDTIGYNQIPLPQEKFKTTDSFLFPTGFFGGISITQRDSSDVFVGSKTYTYEGNEYQVMILFNAKTRDTRLILNSEFIYDFVYPTISEDGSFNGSVKAKLYYNNRYQRLICDDATVVVREPSIVNNEKFLLIHQLAVPVLEGFTFEYTSVPTLPSFPDGSVIPDNPENPDNPVIPEIDINQPELDVPLEYDIVETEADLVKILSQAFEYRIKELKLSKSSLTDGLYYRLLKNLDESIDPENDWIGEIRFIPDDPYYVDDSKRVNEKPLTLSVIYVDELNLFNQIQYYNSKNEYVLCNTTRNFYLGSKESNLATFIKNGVNLSFNAIYKSPYYVECEEHSTNSYHLYPILQTGTVNENTVSFTIEPGKYNLSITDNNKLLFHYIAGICQEDLVGDDASITVAMYVCNKGGNYTVNDRFKKEVNKERSVDITEQKEIGSYASGATVPLLPTFLYRTGDDNLAKSTSSANSYSITIPKSPTISGIDYNLSTMSLGHIQDKKVYPGSIWNKNLKRWTGDYLSVLTNLYKAYKCTQTSEYVSNYAYYKNYSTVYSKDVLVSINPRNVDDCNQYLTIRDFNYVEWLELLNKYRKDKNNKDSNVNIRVLGAMKNFPLVFNFNYKLPIIDVSLPEAEKNAVHTIYGTNSNTVVSVDTTTLYTLDSNGDPIVATAYPYVPKCEYDKFKLESNNTRITYKGSKPEQTLNITELLVDNSLKLEGSYLSLNSFSNSGKYDILTTLRRNWIGKKYNEYLTGLPKNQGFIE